jgi:hypothetical protein
MPLPPPESRVRLAAALGLAFVLAVVLASAAIRLGSASAYFPSHEFFLRTLRGIHRLSASLELLAALWLGWMAWQGRRERPRLAIAAALALVVTLFLAVLGILAGQNPPPVAALGNLLGGLTLTVLFAFMLAAVRRDASRSSGSSFFLLGLFLALQGVIGARISILALKAPTLQLHALLGLALAALLAWAALRRGTRWLFVLALLAPIAGFTALQYDHSAGAAFVHAVAAAAFLAMCAFIFGRDA